MMKISDDGQARLRHYDYLTFKFRNIQPYWTKYLE